MARDASASSFADDWLARPFSTPAKESKMDLATLKAKVVQSRKTAKVTLEGIGEIKVRQLTPGERLRAAGEWMAAGLIDEDGQPTTDDLKPTDIERLDKAHQAFLSTVRVGAINDDGSQLFAGDEGEAVLGSLDTFQVADLANAIMGLSGKDMEDNAGN